MTVRTYRYAAYRTQQTKNSKSLLLFDAPATQIEQWVGIPQRRRVDSGDSESPETVGFQREFNQARLRELTQFFDDDRNVVQNPLLCALQDEHSVTFKPIAEDSSFGDLEIREEVLDGLGLAELMERVVLKLENRIPELQGKSADNDYVNNLLRQLPDQSIVGGFLDSLDDSNSADEDEEDIPGSDDNGELGSLLLAEETQIVDFHRELKARIEVLRRLTEGSRMPEILGFTKTAMLSYLRPLVLVDGQHRLRGAVEVAKRVANTSGQEDIFSAIDEGMDGAAADRAAIDRHARRLPVSLLLDASPSEHVFQFVVVNQKATPMGKALLGTIVSTSLSTKELEPVAERLRAAAIPLDDSRAIAYLARADDSPFRGVVQTGMAGDRPEYLQWNVLRGLSSIFRELRGGRIYGSRVDHADKWKRFFLPDSALVATYEGKRKFEAWKAPDGPWRAVFIRFFSLTKDYFGDPDPDAENGWGDTRRSNLFNKISLTILSADYFQWLCTYSEALNSVDDVDRTFSDWLSGVNRGYFARSWHMDGVKKDQKAVQDTWAKIWTDYRSDPQRLPAVSRYRNFKAV